ncbi:Neurofascin [Frankliniella fusca]|uniref:Neurofascin n=1 Tax=Frankliniella fusca TaxID=407009 RepID=A0AAE1HV70_9NEOP|nr:Neurofascin [Frankliniella fusca]
MQAASLKPINKCTKGRKLSNLFKAEENRLYLLFLQPITKALYQLNLKFQATDGEICVSYQASLLKKLLRISPEQSARFSAIRNLMPAVCLKPYSHRPAFHSLSPKEKKRTWSFSSSSEKGFPTLTGPSTLTGQFRLRPSSYGQHCGTNFLKLLVDNDTNRGQIEAKLTATFSERRDLTVSLKYDTNAVLMAFPKLKSYKDALDAMIILTKLLPPAEWFDPWEKNMALEAAPENFVQIEPQNIHLDG